MRQQMMDLSPRSLLVSLVLLSQTAGVIAQTEAFTRQEVCPNDAALTGYTSISNLNDDMAAELERIQGGGERPDGAYDLLLCPGENFDATTDGPIRPILDQVNIACGGSSSADPVCAVSGGNQQLVIETSTVNGYTIESVSIGGVTFQGTTDAVSATLTASASTVFTCTSCIWQDFEDSDFIVDLTGSMTLRVVDGTVRVRRMSCQQSRELMSFRKKLTKHCTSIDF